MLLTKKECSALRGFAILAISLHNLCHCLDSAPQENEFWFSAINNQVFWNTLQFEQAFIQLFAFWGHLGVPVFVFLSGYGLAIKYNGFVKIEWKLFVWNHYKKLFIPMVIGTIIYQVILLLLSQNTSDVLHLLLQVSLLQNLIPHNLSVFSPGPYWYFGMTLQLYVLYILFRRTTYKYLLLFVIFFFVFQFFLQNHYYTLVWIKYNCFGWLFPFFMGIFIGKESILLCSKRTCYFILPIAFLLIPVLGFQYHLWLMIPIVIPVFAICLVKITPSAIMKPIINIGNISLYIFVIHPIVRQFAIAKTEDVNPYISILIYIVLTIIIASLAKRLVMHLKSSSNKDVLPMAS